jgi:hypothetical protein
VYGTSGVRTLVIRHPEGQLSIKTSTVHEYTPNLVNYEGAYGPGSTYSHQILAQMVNHWREFRIKKRVLKFWQGFPSGCLITNVLTPEVLYTEFLPRNQLFKPRLDLEYLLLFALRKFVLRYETRFEMRFFFRDDVLFFLYDTISTYNDTQTEYTL